MTLYDQLVEAGRDLGLKHFGNRALMSLRLEKGYGAFMREFRADYTPHESGLDRFVAYDKHDFIGRAAALKDRESKPSKKLVPLVVDTEIEVVGYESILKGGEAVGQVTSGGYAHWAGKSMAMGYVKSDLARDGESFEITIFGEPASGQELPALRKRDSVGQASAMLHFRGVPEAERAARVDKQLKLVGLDRWAKKYAHELSGGMQQRVGLARAFATEAPILLMDEPFSALDPLIRTKLQDELLQLQKTLKKTIIFVSHDLEEALKIGNTISIMESGRIVQSGPPEDIVLRPADDYVRDFIANVNPLSVLTAWNVMRSLHELERDGEGWVWLDRRRTTRFKLDAAQKVAAAERDGYPAAWVPCGDADTPPGMAGDARPVYWARPGTTLKTVMLAMHHTDIAPVALFDEDDRFVGAIGVRDVLRAVLKKGE